MAFHQRQDLRVRHRAAVIARMQARQRRTKPESLDVPVHNCVRHHARTLAQILIHFKPQAFAPPASYSHIHTGA